MATAIVPSIYDPSLIDETIFVETEAAESEVRALALERGLLGGWSAGAALVAAKHLLRDGHQTSAATSPVVVVIGPDGGGRYLSEDRRWLEA